MRVHHHALKFLDSVIGMLEIINDCFLVAVVLLDSQLDKLVLQTIHELFAFCPAAVFQSRLSALGMRLFFSQLVLLL